MRRATAMGSGPETTMKRGISLLLCAMFAVTFAAAPARAIGPIIDWDPAYFWELGATPTNQPPGGILNAVGTVSSFGPPLDFLNATMPATEYTFVIGGLVSGGTTVVGPIATQFYVTNYSGGTIDVYADPSPDAVFAPNPPNALVPSTFTDLGAPILSGVFTRFVVNTNNFTTFQVGNIEGDINWTGGSLLNLLRGNNDAVCPGLFTGGATWNTSPGIGIAGYLFRHDGKIDLQCPTPTRKSSWGRLKLLYR